MTQDIELYGASAPTKALRPCTDYRNVRYTRRKTQSRESTLEAPVRSSSLGSFLVNANNVSCYNKGKPQGRRRESTRLRSEFSPRWVEVILRGETHRRTCPNAMPTIQLAAKDGGATTTKARKRRRRQ